MQKIEQIELDLISTCQQVGKIASRNSSYTLFLAGQIKKPINELTILQLLAIHSETLRKYNSMEVSA